MNNIFIFIFNSVLFGIALAMDAFSVSLATGFNEPSIKIGRIILTAGVFAFFQFIMPVIGYFLVHYLAQQFNIFIYFIPWIALILLTYIGGKMLLEFIDNKDGNNENKEENKKHNLFITLLIQGIATSIDALSVGFDIYEYNIIEALTSSLIIAVVTFIICLLGLYIGKKFGMKLGKFAPLLGGIILIGIGIEILCSSLFETYHFNLFMILSTVLIYFLIIFVIERLIYKKRLQ